MVEIRKWKFCVPRFVAHYNIYDLGVAGLCWVYHASETEAIGNETFSTYL